MSYAFPWSLIPSLSNRNRRGTQEVKGKNPISRAPECGICYYTDWDNKHPVDLNYYNSKKRIIKTPQ